MHDASNAETYLKWFQTYLCVLGEKELRAPLDATTVEQRKLLEEFKKFSKAPKNEVTENKVKREVELAATKLKLVEANTIHPIAIQACYDLFRKLLADDPVTSETALSGRSTNRIPGRCWTDIKTTGYG